MVEVSGRSFDIGRTVLPALINLNGAYGANFLVTYITLLLPLTIPTQNQCPLQTALSLRSQSSRKIPCVYPLIVPRMVGGTIHILSANEPLREGHSWSAYSSVLSLLLVIYLCRLNRSLLIIDMMKSARGPKCRWYARFPECYMYIPRYLYIHTSWTCNS